MVTLKHTSNRYLIALVIFYFLIQCGCSSILSGQKSPSTASSFANQENTSNTQKTSQKQNKNEMSSLTWEQYHYYSPLSFTVFSSFRSNNLEFSMVSIRYSHHYNFHPVYPFHDGIIFSLQAGWLGQSRLFDNLETYRGSLSRAIQSEDPPLYEGFDRAFSIEDVDLIFDYLEFEDNEDYFFNGDEFTVPELDIPYRTQSGHINGKNFSFTLKICKPNSTKESWVISKCMDEPDPIMQGLIVILEEHFISQFE